MSSPLQPPFSVTILGSNSALPAYNRHPTAQLLNVNNHYYLVDCGEGTQMQLRSFGLKMQRIKVVFISHLHGDHYFGLIGLLNSLHLLGRKTALKVVGPSQLKDILDLQMEAANGRLQFPVSYSFTDDIAGTGRPKLVYSDQQLQVRAFPLKHRILCCGFLFSETRKERKFTASMAGKYNIPVSKIPKIKKGADFKTEEGRTIPNEELTTPAPAPRTYAFCTDTAPVEGIVPFIRGVDLLYHEATFTDDHAARAKKTFHSTAKQAAEIARKGEVGRLLIGHFSARYKDLAPLLEEAKSVFEPTALALEGEEYDIPRS